MIQFHFVDTFYVHLTIKCRQHRILCPSIQVECHGPRMLKQKQTQKMRHAQKQTDNFMMSTFNFRFDGVSVLCIVCEKNLQDTLLLC